jgi:hypothetical protein
MKEIQLAESEAIVLFRDSKLPNTAPPEVEVEDVGVDVDCEFNVVEVVPSPLADVCSTEATDELAVGEGFVYIVAGAHSSIFVVF